MSVWGESVVACAMLSSQQRMRRGLPAGATERSDRAAAGPSSSRGERDAEWHRAAKIHAGPGPVKARAGASIADPPTFVIYARSSGVAAAEWPTASSMHLTRVESHR